MHSVCTGKITSQVLETIKVAGEISIKAGVHLTVFGFYIDIAFASLMHSMCGVVTSVVYAELYKFYY